MSSTNFRLAMYLYILLLHNRIAVSHVLCIYVVFTFDCGMAQVKYALQSVAGFVVNIGCLPVSIHFIFACFGKRPPTQVACIYLHVSSFELLFLFILVDLESNFDSLNPLPCLRQAQHFHWSSVVPPFIFLTQQDHERLQTQQLL